MGACAERDVASRVWAVTPRKRKPEAGASGGEQGGAGKACLPTGRTVTSRKSSRSPSPGVCRSKVFMMHLVLRSCGQMASRLACQAALRRGTQAPACQRAWLGSTLSPASSATACVLQSKQAKDYSLPNSSWSPDMMAQFNKYMEMSKDGMWKKLPSYRDILDHMPKRMREEYEEEMNKESRMFLRNLDEEGKGFEYVMFLNWSEKRVACVFQLGPYLEGPPGFVHGGSIAAMLDSVLGCCAMSLLGQVMTANLNINYKSPIPLGSVVLAESKLDKLEGRKAFISGHVRSVDGETLHAEATGLFIQLASQKTPQPPERSK